MVLFIRKQFWKAKISVILLSVMFTMSYLFFVFLAMTGRAGYDLLHILSRFQFYLCFLWVCLTFYFVSGAERNYVREATGVFPQGKFVYEDTALFWIMVKFGVWNFGMILILCAGACVNDGSGYFYTWFWKSYFYNIIFPQLICIGLAYVINLMKNQIGWFGFLLVFLFMASPYTEDMKWENKAFQQIEQIWEGFRWPFSIFYQNGEWSPDLQYGLQTERVRFFLFLFWIFIIFAMAIKCHNGKKGVYILLVCLAMASVLYSFSPASLYRLNSSVIFGDKIIYGEKSLNVDEEKVNYTVRAYRLGLSMGNEMKVQGQMDIQSKTPRNKYAFTLYRGYRVDKVKSMTEGVHVMFRQTEDELLVTTDCKVSRISIEIDYKGYHPIFYSNSEATMLPGWFPWYPMAGKKQIYITVMGNSGYNSYNHIEEADCRLEIYGPIVTNLEKRKEGIYEGKADSITVLAGNIVETDKQNLVRDYLPLGLHKDTPAESYVSEKGKEFSQELDLLEGQCGLDVSGLRNRKILLASEDLGRNRENNNLAIFESYILAAPEYLNADTLFQYLALESCARYKVCQDSAIIQNSVHSLIFRRTSEETMEHYQKSVKRWSDFGEQYRVSEEYLDIMKQYMEQKKAGEFIRGLADYILHPDTYRNDNGFIGEMVERL